MEQNFIKKIGEIMHDVECPKGFECIKNGFKNISKTKIFANEYFTFVGTNSCVCPHALSFGYTELCTCPLFVYVATEYYKRPEAFDKDYPLKEKPNVLVE